MHTRYTVPASEKQHYVQEKNSMHIKGTKRKRRKGRAMAAVTGDELDGRRTRRARSRRPRDIREEYLGKALLACRDSGSARRDKMYPIRVDLQIAECRYGMKEGDKSKCARWSV